MNRGYTCSFNIDYITQNIHVYIECDREGGRDATERTCATPGFPLAFGFSCLASSKHGVKGIEGRTRSPALFNPLPPAVLCSLVLALSPSLLSALPFSLQLSYFTVFLFAAPQPDSSFPGPFPPPTRISFQFLEETEAGSGGGGDNENSNKNE